jgi:DNA-binding transcriptional MerR regulator
MQDDMRELTIKEASQRLGVTCHTLRFWEKELEGVIVPLRTQGGQRRYTKAHLYILEDIKKLKSRGLSLIEIKNILNRKHGQVSFNPPTQEVDFIANHLAEIVKSAVYKILKEES